VFRPVLIRRPPNLFTRFAPPAPDVQGKTARWWFWHIGSVDLVSVHNSHISAQDRWCSCLRGLVPPPQVGFSRAPWSCAEGLIYIRRSPCRDLRRSRR